MAGPEGRRRPPGPAPTSPWTARVRRLPEASSRSASRVRPTGSTRRRTAGRSPARRSAWPSSTRWWRSTPTTRPSPTWPSRSPRAPTTRSGPSRSVPQITFHDGTPLTGAAIATMFNAHLLSALTRPALAPIESATATGDLTCVVKMKTPWVTFPDSLTSQLGMVPAPSMFNADGTPTDDGGTKPVGTGPFEFKSWSPGQPFDATRNDGYWRKDCLRQPAPLPGVDRVPGDPRRQHPRQRGPHRRHHHDAHLRSAGDRDAARAGQERDDPDRGGQRRGRRGLPHRQHPGPGGEGPEGAQGDGPGARPRDLQHHHQRRDRRGRRTVRSRRARSGTPPPTTRASTSTRPSSWSTSTPPRPATRRRSRWARRPPRATTRRRSCCSRCSSRRA